MDYTTERSIFDGYIEKLAGVCDENDFVYELQKNHYPIILTIKPDSSMEAQISMMEDDIGYNHTDSKIRFFFSEGKCTYKISDGFTIAESTFNKLKNLAKNIHFAWLQVFFRDEMERRRLCDKCVESGDAADADTDTEE